MASKYFTGVTDGIVQKATNWNGDALPADGDTLVFDSDVNAPSGYADGTAPTLTDGLTEDGAFSITVQGAAILSASQILDDLGNQTVVDVTVTGGSSLDYDITEAIGGDVSVSASDMTVAANAAITGTVDVDTGGEFTCDGTSAITGAVTVDSSSCYNANSSHTLTGGITVTGGTLTVATTVDLTSAVDLAGGTLTLVGTGEVVGAVTDSAAANTINLGTAGVITGIVDLGACTWTGIGTFTADTTGALNLGGTAANLDVIINGAAQRMTIGAGGINCRTFTMTDGTVITDSIDVASVNTVAFVATAGTLTESTGAAGVALTVQRMDGGQAVQIEGTTMSDELKITYVSNGVTPFVV